MKERIPQPNESESKEIVISRIKNGLEMFRRDYFLALFHEVPHLPYGAHTEEAKDEMKEFEFLNKGKRILELLEGDNYFSEFIRGSENFEEVLSKANLRIFELSQGEGLSLDELENVGKHALKNERYEILSKVENILKTKYEGIATLYTVYPEHLLEMLKSKNHSEFKDINLHQIQDALIRTITINPERLTPEDWGVIKKLMQGDYLTATHEEKLNKLAMEHSLDFRYEIDELSKLFEKSVENEDFLCASNTRNRIFERIDLYKTPLKDLLGIMKFSVENRYKEPYERCKSRIQERVNKEPVAMSREELLEIGEISVILGNQIQHKKIVEEIKKRKYNDSAKDDHFRAQEIILNRECSYKYKDLEKYLLALKEKPPVLYHGTINSSIEEFHPRSAPERPDEDAAIYASPNFEIAAQSMANKFVSNGGIVNGRKFVCIPMEREEFIKHDQGGTVYTFPSDSFKVNDGLGLGKEEYVSKDSVKPIEKIQFSSLLEKLLEQRTEVYFIKPEMVSIITNAQDGEPEDLEKLLDSLESENKRAKR